MVNGAKHMRMKFYIQSPHKVGTVYAEVKQVHVYLSIQWF